SGALVVSKDDRTHQGLSQVFSKHEIDRRYWAFCYGSTKLLRSGVEHTVESTIGRNPTDRKRMAPNIKGGRRAITLFRAVKEYAQPRRAPFASWIEARLETGRTHQVRVHLTSLGCSILGDPVYGKPSSVQAKWKNLPA